MMVVLHIQLIYYINRIRQNVKDHFWQTLKTGNQRNNNLNNTSSIIRNLSSQIIQSTGIIRDTNSTIEGLSAIISSYIISTSKYNLLNIKHLFDTQSLYACSINRRWYKKFSLLPF